MIIAFAGNRIDRCDEQRRFPADAVGHVRDKVAAALAENAPSLAVGAAAAGADLIVLTEAARLSIPVHVTLPLNVSEFRQRSVEDHDADWVAAFDRTMDECQGLTTSDLSAFDDWYLRGNDLILDTALDLAAGRQVMAMVIAAQDDHDSASGDFAEKAAARHWPVRYIDPLG